MAPATHELLPECARWAGGVDEKLKAMSCTLQEVHAGVESIQIKLAKSEGALWLGKTMVAAIWGVILTICGVLLKALIGGKL